MRIGVDSRKPTTPERTLRRLFLTLFLRGRGARGLTKANAPTTVGRKLLLTLLFYTVIGIAAVALEGQSVFALAVYLHAMTLVLVGMFVATSAGEVLFNKEEADILLHRPIAPRALLWAKIGMLVQVSLWLAGAFNLVGLLVGLSAKDGSWLFPFVHLFSTSLEALFCSATVVMIYQLCLRWFGREKLDSLMTATQTLVSVAIVVLAQLGPRLMTRIEGTALVTVDRWWIVLLPPSWFAGIDDALAGSGAASSWWLALAGVVATGVVLWVAFGKLAKDYQSGLQTISEAPVRRAARARRPVLSRIVAAPPLGWWLRDPVSRASFLLSAAYLVRDRDVKLRVYPGLAPMLVMPVIMLFPSGSGGGSGSFGVAFAGSYLGLLPLLTLTMLEYSQGWQAADIFRLAPMHGPAAVVHGARRAVLLLITLPMILLSGIIVLFVAQTGTPLALMLPGLIAIPVYAMIPCLGGKAVPLSRPPDQSKAAGRSSTMIMVMISSGVVAGITVWAHSGGWFRELLAGEVVLVTALYLLMRARVTAARWPAID